MLLHLESSLLRKSSRGTRFNCCYFIGSSSYIWSCKLNFSRVIAVLKQIGSAITSVGDNNPYALAVILGLVIPVTGMTPLSSMVLTSLLGLTGIPMAIGALTCTGASFVNGILFSKLKIGNKGNAFAVFVEPLTQIDLIAKYPLQLFVRMPLLVL